MFVTLRDCSQYFGNVADFLATGSPGLSVLYIMYMQVSSEMALVICIREILTLNLGYRKGPSENISLGFSQSCTENFEIAPPPVLVLRKPSIYRSLNAIKTQPTNCSFGVNP